MNKYIPYIAGFIAISSVGTGLILNSNPDILHGLKSAIITYPPPQIFLSASPTSVQSGQNSTVIWQATNVYYCTLTTGSTNDYSPSATPISGSKVVGPLTASRNIYLSCRGKNGVNTNRALAISVIPPSMTGSTIASGISSSSYVSTGVTLVNSGIIQPPNVTLGTSSGIIARGKQTSITWTSSGATSCKFTEGDTQFKSNENTKSGNNRYTQSLYADQVYTLVCTGAGGSTTKSITINVVQPQPVQTTVTPVKTAIDSYLTGLKSSIKSKKSQELYDAFALVAYNYTDINLFIIEKDKVKSSIGVANAIESYLLSLKASVKSTKAQELYDAFAMTAYNYTDINLFIIDNSKVKGKIALANSVYSYLLSLKNSVKSTKAQELYDAFALVAYNYTDINQFIVEKDKVLQAITEANRSASYSASLSGGSL